MNPVLLGFLKSIVFIYEILAYIPYLIFANPYNKIKESEKIKAKQLNSVPDSAYRSVETFNDLKSPLFNDCNTLDDVFRIVVGLYPTRRCYGTREVFAEENEPQSNGKVFKKLVLGDYHWETFEEVNRRIHHFGSGLQALGLKPRQVFVIFAETRAEWQIAAQAGFKFNFPVATIYATLGEEALIHGINETDVSVVVTSSELLPKFKTILNGCPKVTHVIYMENKWKRVSPIGYKDGVQILSFSEVEAMGATPDSLAVTPDKPKSDDVAVIMYTSGSTGQPKGVIISHLNLITAAAGIVAPVPEPSPDDVYIGYLPLAHVLELAAELACMSYGIAIGYSSAFTLSDQSTKIKKGCKGDASVLQPTLFATVPLIFDRVYKAVIEKVNEGGEFSKTLFHFAYDYKMNCLETGYSTPIIDKLIFGKIRNLLGGKVRAMFCGGAPLSPVTHRFMNICFCCPVLQGYGLTETCGGAAVMRATDLMVGHVGAPIRYVDIKLKNWEEGNYRNTDKPNPRGEIIIGGNNVSLGYFKNEEKTQEDFYNENGNRWFATGDIGEILPDGSLKIIDRKKDLVKLQAGEYVSLSKVETLLKTCPYVDNICVYGDSLKTFVIGLLVPNQKNLLALANDLVKDTSNLEQLYQDKDINKAILSAIIKHGKQMKLERFEIPEKLFIVQEIWLPDTGLVTEAFKLKRKVIQDFYQCVIDRMYA